ncbi:hypothetical protein CFOL_v3_31820 [Cephalotus follicularis]|uniref:ABC transporter family G domain-containing protein n=1 Tax=Cephalotus follicularis TaxID=3775 RepID=A0A1Q3D7C1_CEPFO|nr:hypothetical protein CFOL_v3_31820 [Cephalotus follicularis]
MDEVSTSLDSSMTYHIVNSLKQYVHILNGTSQIVYQGPHEHVLEFFESMGFKC